MEVWTTELTDLEFEALWKQLVAKGQQGYLSGEAAAWSKLSSESNTVKELVWQVQALKSMVKGLVMALTDKGYLIPVSLDTPIMVPNPKPESKKAFSFAPYPALNEAAEDFWSKEESEQAKKWVTQMEPLYKALENGLKKHNVKIVKKKEGEKPP